MITRLSLKNLYFIYNTKIPHVKINYKIISNIQHLQKKIQNYIKYTTWLNLDNVQGTVHEMRNDGSTKG